MGSDATKLFVRHALSIHALYIFIGILHFIVHPIHRSPFFFRFLIFLYLFPAQYSSISLKEEPKLLSLLDAKE